MWPKTFEQRLDSWVQLRQQATTIDVETALQNINAWWFQTPWVPYHLHWDDQATWPDPWQLLSDNIYCDIARGLGIMYTIAILDRPEIQDADLVEVGSDNLVRIAGGKYILNWDKDEIVNINSALKPNKLRRCLAQSTIKKQIS
jgi:hypothetical protein